MRDGWRKSVQPTAERLPDGNMRAPQQFVKQSPWDPLPVRRRTAERPSEVIPPEVRVIDDLSFPQCGATRFRSDQRVDRWKMPATWGPAR